MLRRTFASALAGAALALPLTAVVSTPAVAAPALLATTNIRVVASDGWPQANLGPVGPTGTVTVWMGRQAVQQGYSVVRIAAHELGHSLGLPDVKPGPCSSLMSGSTGGVSCANTKPNAAEAARVQRNYASALVVQNAGGVLSDGA